MPKDTAYFYIGIGINIIFGILQVVVNEMPLLLTMIGFIIGAIFIIIGIIGWIKSRRNKTIFNNYDKSLVLTPHAWAIGLSGMTGYPKKT